MSNLILHCGAQHIDRTALYGLPDPESQGRWHQPIHHADFLDQVEGALTRHGYQINAEALGLTPDGNRLFGVMEVQHQALQVFNGTSYTLGLRGSHDRSLSRGLATGSRVFVCDNLAFNGEQVMNTKQTTHVFDRLPRLIDDMIQRLREAFALQFQQLDSYAGTRISSTQADAAILELGRQGIVNWGELGKVTAEWDTPTHPEFAEDGPTVWRLFNAATEALKPRNPEHPRLPKLAPKTVKLHTICDQLAAA